MVSTIPHGVDLDIFKKIEKPRGIPVIPDDSFVIGMVGRNQPRKQLPRLLKMLSIFIRSWIKCSNCGAVIVAKEDDVKCLNCGSDDINFYPSKDDVYAYLHCSVNDKPGWDIKELISRYNLNKRVIYPKNNEVGMGVPDRVLADFYNTFDVFTLPTQGEGFGLPILEAMACGTPTVVTDYSGHVDFCGGVSDLIMVSEFITDPRTNIERAIVDIDDYIMRMERYYYEEDVFMEKWGEYINAKYGVGKIECGKEYKEKMGVLSLERAQNYDWEKILPVWTKLFSSILKLKESEKQKYKIKSV
jgi:glycosyltransferase involved in cell wall biosynthesis